MEARTLKLRQLTEWRDQALSSKDDWIKTVALALAAARCLEMEVDLNVDHWPFLADLLVAAEERSDEEAFARLEAFEQSFQQRPPLALIAADADQIQTYVFESAKIPEVRGASALVEWLNIEGLKEVVGHFGLTENALVYQGGGGAMGLVPAAMADNILQAIEEQYVSSTHVATITGVCQFVSLRDLLERARFRKVRTALMHDLQVRKLQKESPVHFEWLPLARRCQACEIRPACETYLDSADRPMLCEACKAKRDKGHAEQLPWRFHDYLSGRLENKETVPYLYSVEVSAPTPENVLGTVGRAEDLEEFADKGYVSVIAADGDSVGQILTQLDSLREYAEFSKSLYRLSNQCVYEPVARLLRVRERRQPRARQQRQFHPFELITLGGDDLFLIVPANKGLIVAQSITDYWRDHCAQVIPRNRRDGADKILPPTLSLGLLICPHTFPLYFMHQLAEQLLQSAKAARSKAEEGFVNFLVLKGSGTPRTEAGQLQETMYRYREGRYGETVLYLTERPYTLTAFSNLVQTASTLRQAGMTRTQRHALARSLRLGRLRSTMDVLLYWTRRSERDEDGKHVRKCLEEWLQRLQSEQHKSLVFPWCRDEKRRYETWTTQLLDVLELMEWTEETGNDADRDDGNMGGGDTL